MTKSALFESNLSSLESRGLVSAHTVAALRSASEGTSRLSLSPDGGWLFEDASDGVRLLLHSRRDPKGEAVRQLDAWSASGSGRYNGLVVVFGAAGLFHVAALAERLRHGSKLVVVEPLPEILASALASVPLSGLERPGVELRFVSHSDMPGLLEELRFALRRLERLDVAVFIHRASARVAPSLYESLERGFADKLRHESLNRETLVRFTRQWVLNSLANLPQLASSAPVDAFEGLFAGCSAIAIGAGPSLDASLEMLASLRRSFLLVAAGTALKPLLKAGLVPDFVVAVDSDPKTLWQYEGVDLSGLRLAASCNVDPRLPAFFPGRTCFFSANLSGGLNRWLEMNGLLPGRLSAGGTVIVSAVDFARLLGCRSIALCGVDLAMADGGVSHSSGSVYGGMRESGLVPVKGNWSPTVMTTSQFSAYIGLVGNFIHDLRHRRSVEVFNANDQGAWLPNAKLIRPGDLPSLALLSPEEGRGRIEGLLRSAPRLPGGVSAGKAVDCAASWLEPLCADIRHALDLAKESPGAADPLFRELEAHLKVDGSGSLLLDALLEVELRGFSAEPGAGPVKLHSKVLDAATAILDVLRPLRGRLPGGGA